MRMAWCAITPSDRLESKQTALQPYIFYRNWNVMFGVIGSGEKRKDPGCSKRFMLEAH